MSLKAVNNYCTFSLIRPDEHNDESLISIPEHALPTPRWGKVESTGPGFPDAYGNLRALDVEVGDLIYISAHGQYAVHQAVGQNVNLSAASILDVLAILKDMNTRQIQPLGNLIQIEKIEIYNDSDVISIPDQRKSPTNLGRVVSVGKGWTSVNGDIVPPQVKVGDKIVYSPLRTMVVDFASLGVEEKTYLIQHGDIIAVLED